MGGMMRRLREELGRNGLLEYVSIPWENHHHRREDGQGQEKWTINLALWFVHILAGYNHQP